MTYSLINLQASSAAVKLLNRAVGILCLVINFFEKSLLDSIWAALDEGPKQGIPTKQRQHIQIIRLINEKQNS